MSDSPMAQRLRITFGKQGSLKYTSNLDIAKVWERVLRRAHLPILYTQGFNARPRLQIAIALPLGITSECELLDVALREQIDIDGLAERIMAASPDGLYVYDIEEVAVHENALEREVESAEYSITFVDGIDIDGLRNQVENMLAQDRIMKVEYNRRGKKTAYDLRPLIHDMQVDDDGQLHIHVATGTRGNVRPDMLLTELGYGEAFVHIHRTKLHIRD
ncbi:MAG: TIGR03936 family radical SAM-associated protein [Anaerolineae bacterium]|nr:TIGR03936 family radical SAM-associated protein [Anaerolineae bacterium]MCA9892874.1 TIGR03936 family radical SAM-associated protein [Anaerolineae bacterium]